MDTSGYSLFFFDMDFWCNQCDRPIPVTATGPATTLSDLMRAATQHAAVEHKALREVC